MSISSTGGSLHGTWSSETIISASDRRLKRRIEPLDRALATASPAKHKGGAKRAASGPGTGEVSSRQKSVDWLLRELRPVSYRFKDGPDAKYARYGFVAQELEKLMPNLVRTHKEEKHVVYQDLIALLTLSSQVQQGRLEQLESRSRERSERLKGQASLLKKLTGSVKPCSEDQQLGKPGKTILEGAFANEAKLS